MTYAVQFPLTVSEWGKAIRYQTDITVGRNGQEVRNALWQDPLLRFNAAFAVRSYADIDTLADFFHAMKGREQSFLVKDWSDFSITRAQGALGTGDGADAIWQLVKNYVQSGVGTYSRTIKYPATGSMSVWVNNVLQTLTTHYSFSTTTGIITFVSAPANGHAIEAACTEFYVPCRFDTDELPIEMLSYWVASGADRSNVNVPDIPIVEVRE